jgi:hypothetical protein
MEIRFTSNAQVRGVGYRRGDVAEFDRETCAAYIGAGQAVPHFEPVKSRAKPDDKDTDDADEGDADSDDDPQKTETTTRGGRRVRKATKPSGAKR